MNHHCFYLHTLKGPFSRHSLWPLLLCLSCPSFPPPRLRKRYRCGSGGQFRCASDRRPEVVSETRQRRDQGRGVRMTHRLNDRYCRHQAAAPCWQRHADVYEEQKQINMTHVKQSLCADSALVCATWGHFP